MLLVTILVAGTAGAGDPGEAKRDPLAAECEYGITLAMGGKLERAEEVFTSLLGHSPGDARALNNLGNLYVLRSGLEVASRSTRGPEPVTRRTRASS